MRAAPDYDRATAGRLFRPTRDEVLSWIADLAAVLEHHPSQRFLTDWSWIDKVPAASVERVLPLAYERPELEDVRTTCGSWFLGLVQAGVLPNGSQRMTRGTRVVAADGCICLSLGEATIDDVFSRAGVQHEREVRYPGSSLRSDWKVGDHFVEYFGLAGDPAYDQRTAQKRALAQSLELSLVEIYPADLDDLPTLLRRLEQELAVGLSPTPPAVHAAAPTSGFDYVDLAQRRAASDQRKHRFLARHLERGAVRVPGGANYFKGRLVHRDDGPAEIWFDGRIGWRRRGKQHRDDGPAVYRPGGLQQWWCDGHLHRLGAPAEISPRPDGTFSLVWFTLGEFTAKYETSIDEELPHGWYLADPGPLE